MATFSPKIDKISENIIFLLSLDSRISISYISKELKVERKIVETRYNNLFSKGYIKPLSISNEPNRFRFTILVKLSTFQPDLMDKVKKIDGLLKLKETLGTYDISMLFDVYSQQTKEEIIDKVSNVLSKNTLTFDVIDHTYEDTLGYKSFCHDPHNLAKFNPLQPNMISLEPKELQVLELIKENPLDSFVSLSKKTKLNYLKLKGIVEKFLTNNIVRFSVDPDYNKLGLQFHNVLLKIKPGKREEFDNYIQKHPRIHWVKKSLGKWNYILSITAQDINEFIDISKQIRADNQDSVLEETSLISKINEARKY